jgi:hypothetical protein
MMNVDQTYLQAMLKDLFAETYGDIVNITHDEFCRFVDDSFQTWKEENGDLYTESDLQFAEAAAYTNGMFDSLEDVE